VKWEKNANAVAVKADGLIAKWGVRRCMELRGGGKKTPGGLRPITGEEGVEGEGEKMCCEKR